MDYLRWLIYLFSETLRTMRENLATTLITVLTIAISLTICGLFIGIFLNLNNILNSIGSHIQVVVYIKDGLSDDEISDIKREVAKMPEVEDLEYISKEKAFTLFKNDLKGGANILDALDINPLPPSLEIKIKTPYRNTSGIDGLISKLKLLGGVDDIQYGKEWIDKLFTLIKFVEAFALIIGVFIFMATSFIISNTIRLAIYTRKEEIEIMELLGATNMFTKIPFFIEGIIEGFLGAVLSVGMLYLTSLTISREIPPIFASLFITPFSISHFSLGLILSGIILGLIGSSVSLRKFFKN